jgi:TonB-linked SusC/RagA family outer membrane protein
MKKILLFCVVTMMAISVSWAQRTVTGTVTGEEDGTPVPGVNVIVKGTSGGTVTDIDGKYQIGVPEDGGILVFSFIGLATEEVDIGNQSVIDMVMTADIRQLTEVVVTAMGIERQSRDIGYSISTVKSDELTVARETNIINSLQGKVSGVQITQQSGNLGGSSKILIRGVSSLSGGNNPLWVVDGVPIYDSNISTGDRISGGFDTGNRASDLNPDDIETISILKGASAAALYGSRASNGVIVVTTKKGKGGKNRTQIAFNSTYRFDNPLRLPDYQNTYGPGNAGKYDINGGAGWGPKIEGQEVIDFAEDTVQLTAYPDNVKDFYRTGKTAINNISLSGGNQDADFRTSLTWLDQEGISPGSSLDRYTIAFNGGTKLANNFTGRASVNYVRTESSGRVAQGANDPNVLTNIVNFWPRTTDLSKLGEWIDENGDPINNLDDFTNNPYWVAYENRFDNNVDRLIGNVSFEWSPLEYLSLFARAGLDNIVDKRFRSNRVGTVGREPGDFTDDWINQQQLTYDLYLNYKDNFGDFSLKGIVGYQFNQRKFERLSNDANQLTVPELFSPANAANNTPIKDYSLRRLAGAYYDITISYKNWLSFNTTGRNDWSSTLPEKNRSYFYPSASLSWIFTDAFKISSDLLSYGKLRASAAQVGGDTGPYQLDFNYFPQTTVFGQYGTGNVFPFGGRLAFSGPGTFPPGDELKPERQNSYEIGTELQFFNGRIGLDVAYYDIRTTDQILAVSIPESTGFSFRRTNVGVTSNKGIEIELNADVVRAGDFNWNLLWTYTQNKFLVEELTEGVDRLVINSGFNSTQVVAEPGESFGLYGNLFAVDTVSGKYIIDPTTGLRQQGENGRLGNVFPDYIMGFVNNFTYKGWSLRFTIDYRKGGKVFSNTTGGLRRAGLAEETAVNREGTFVDTEGVN